MENLVELIIKGMGVALLMKPLALYLANPKIKIMDVTPTMSTDICLCHLKGIELADAAKHFITCTEIQRSNNDVTLLQEEHTRKMFQA